MFRPKSGEVIIARANFAALNDAAFPAAGHWSFTVYRIFNGESEATSDVTVSDGAVTFHRTASGLIFELVEYWPDPFEPSAWQDPGSVTRRQVSVEPFAGLRLRC
ncbi:hypothetical protein DEA8626_00435 [Defluviimonas aquaemixtae]|uniref:Uncharacterized protein n=1 Tax=Albidovulum aquaemixtae TaxID=1542388 RepID=A0A2R8B2R7_9RHOB|nr:hypothetical protein DEA8626_00435 [Defluviimonas aquaemixtae]